MPNLTDLQAVELQIQSIGAGRIKVGDAEPNPGTNDFNISRKSIDQLRITAEQRIVTRLSRFYVVPLTLTDPDTVRLLKECATKATGYEIYLTLHTMHTIPELPAVVTLWNERVKEILDQVAPTGRANVQAGVDVILAGETLIRSGDDATTANVFWTDAFPHGASTT